LVTEFSERIASEEFAQIARHPDFPKAFTRNSKLPLPALIAALLSMRNQSQQAMLDGFFASVHDTATPVRVVTDRAFATARNHLHLPALTSLNDLVVRRADEAGLVARWCGLRVVAGDASVLMPAVRPCLLSRSAAAPDQRLFALYLPGAELTLHASVHSALVAERSMLVEALDLLGPDDVLVLDRGYPAAWLVGLLNARGIRFVMRCDNDSGWNTAKTFLRSDQAEALVTVNAPSAQDVRDWGCPAQAPTLRLVRQIAPNGKVRALATNLDGLHFPAVPAESFAELYHQRWRIEEAFKRIKLRLKLEAVSGLSQQALIIDVAAKILADNITSLMCAAGSEDANLPARSRKCNRSYAASFMQRVLPRLALFLGNVAAAISDAIAMLGANSQRFVPGRSQPRPPKHAKPHPSCSYKA
jgi:DDE family transposase